MKSINIKRSKQGPLWYTSCSDTSLFHFLLEELSRYASVWVRERLCVCLFGILSMPKSIYQGWECPLISVSMLGAFIVNFPLVSPLGVCQQHKASTLTPISLHIHPEKGVLGNCRKNNSQQRISILKNGEKLRSCPKNIQIWRIQSSQHPQSRRVYHYFPRNYDGINNKNLVSYCQTLKLWVDVWMQASCQAPQ